jgi:hypothetical protein
VFRMLRSKDCFRTRWSLCGERLRTKDVPKILARRPKRELHTRLAFNSLQMPGDEARLPGEFLGHPEAYWRFTNVDLKSTSYGNTRRSVLACEEREAWNSRNARPCGPVPVAALGGHGRLDSGVEV